MRSNLVHFQNFIHQVQTKVHLRDAIDKLSNFKIREYKIDQISVQEAFNMYLTIQDKFYKKEKNRVGINWYENQLRIFVWVLVNYSSLTNCCLQNLKEEDIIFLRNLFPYKETNLFLYQVKFLEKEHINKKIWFKQQQDLIINYMNNQENAKIKWSDISKELFYISNGQCFRTAKQCKQHWNIHLNPKKVKGGWKKEQILKIFLFVKENGRKWSRLAKELGTNRDEHSVKNKYRSLIRKEQKLNHQLNEEQICQIIINRNWKEEEKKSETYCQKFMSKLKIFKAK